MLNNLLGDLLRFRGGQCAIMGYISKMYHSIGLALFDQMVHCFLWRDHRLDEQPGTYAITAVNFGDDRRQLMHSALCKKVQ